MYWSNLYAEILRREDQVAEIQREQEARDLLGEQAKSYHRILLAFGKQLSNAGNSLQSRYGGGDQRSNPSEVSYRFN